MSKYKPAIFQATVRPSWGGVLSYLSAEEKAQILEAIINYPKNTNIISKFWAETIKPDLDTQYDAFVNTCYARGRGARTYWETKSNNKVNLSLPLVNHKVNSLKDKDKDKDKIQDKDKNKNNRYGELKNVILTQEQYETLSGKYPNLNMAIEKLDTWLGTSGSKNRNKNHFAYFKSNSWVWENLPKGEVKTQNTKPNTLPVDIDLWNGEYYDFNLSKAVAKAGDNPDWSKYNRETGTFDL